MRRHGALHAATAVFAASALLCLFACHHVPKPENDPVLETPFLSSATVSAPTITHTESVTITVRFVGDSMVSKAMTNGAKLSDGAYDFDPIWNAIRPEFTGAA